MRHIQTRRPLPKKREGFTLIELLVVISIIATLVALITPAVQSAREAARRTQCINNMKNIALAVKNFASQTNGKLPTLWNNYPLPGGGNEQYGWPVKLLPLMDNAAIYDRIISTGALPDSSGNMTNYDRPGLVLKMFLCPDDIEKDGRGGGMSYTANIGYVSDAHWGSTDIGNNAVEHLQASIDWNGIGGIQQADVDANRATAVFIDPKTCKDPNAAGAADPSFDCSAMTEDGVSRADGLGNTLMLAENLQADNWASWRAGHIGFGLSVDNGGAGGPISGSDTGAYVGGTPVSLLIDFTSGWTLNGTATSGDDNRINTGLNTSIQSRWRPSSNHPGIVVVAFCDGRAQTISDTIDGGVYARLITPVGTRRHNQRLDGDGSY